MTIYWVAVQLEVSVEADSDEEALALAEDVPGWLDSRFLAANGITGAESEGEEAAAGAPGSPIPNAPA